MRDLLVEVVDPLSPADSFHEGADKAGAFDITLMRLFKTAIIELEYIFATSSAAAI